MALDSRTIEYEKFLSCSELLLDGITSGGGGLVGRGVLAEPLLEGGKITVTAVVNTSLVVLGIELKSWLLLAFQIDRDPLDLVLI